MARKLIITEEKLRMCLDGKMTVRQIAGKLRVTPNAVRHAMKRLEVQRDDTG